MLISTNVVYALLQASHPAEFVNVRFEVLSHVIKLAFVSTLAYAFYLQRKLFQQFGFRNEGRVHSLNETPVERATKESDEEVEEARIKNDIAWRNQTSATR